MTDSINFSIKIKNYKCFGDEEQGFDKILPVNLIIGRNNSGKTTLLEVIEKVLSETVNFPPALWHKNQPPELILEHELSEKELRQVFDDNMSGGPIAGSHVGFGMQWLGKRIKWEILNTPPGGRKFISVDPPFGLQDGGQFANNLVSIKQHPFSNKIFQRLFAERDLVPETDNPSVLEVKGNGLGATNIVQNFINKVVLPRDLVEDVILTELNLIVEPDMSFTDIVCQQHPSGFWEIYLKENIKGVVPLSHTGSGLKTIILALIFLHLLPYKADKKLSDYIFAFEELENNMHPALLRRLLLFLRNKAIKEHFILFLTTHSNVTIDLFSRDASAQIIHVTHNGEKANSIVVKTYIEHKGVLDDLDVRASDLLQSNGLIWVEGPTDRIYINRWISLHSDGKLQEGAHYQCVFYGGRLLAHLTAEDPEQLSNDVVSILKINQNAIIVMDSDKRNAEDTINATKKRMQDEIERIGGLPWITQGREIENYIAAEAISNLYTIPGCRQVKQFESFADYLNEIKTGEGDKFVNNKVIFAEKISPHFSKENCISILDLAEKITKVCDRIKTWNRM